MYVNSYMPRKLLGKIEVAVFSQQADRPLNVSDLVMCKEGKEYGYT